MRVNFFQNNLNFQNTSLKTKQSVACQQKSVSFCAANNYLNAQEYIADLVKKNITPTVIFDLDRTILDEGMKIIPEAGKLIEYLNKGKIKFYIITASSSQRKRDVTKTLGKLIKEKNFAGLEFTPVAPFLRPEKIVKNGLFFSNLDVKQEVFSKIKKENNPDGLVFIGDDNAIDFPKDIIPCTYMEENITRIFWDVSDFNNRSNFFLLN